MFPVLFFLYSFVLLSQSDPKSREVVLNACKAVGSISNTSFDIRFNPDIFSPGEHDQLIIKVQYKKGFDNTDNTVALGAVNMIQCDSKVCSQLLKYVVYSS